MVVPLHEVSSCRPNLTSSYSINSVYSVQTKSHANNTTWRGAFQPSGGWEPSKSPNKTITVSLVAKNKHVESYPNQEKTLSILNKTKNKTEHK